MRRGALAAALAALVYLNALDNPFVYDDRDTIVANPSLVDPSNIRFVLTHSPFRPVVNASYAIDRAMWGYRPLGFHVTNVLLHAGVVALLYALLRRALADTRTRRGDSPQSAERADQWAAFTGAALFGVHPLMTEAVAYVSGRSELLCGLFFLAAVLCGRAAIAADLRGSRAIAADLRGSRATAADLRGSTRMTSTPNSQPPTSKAGGSRRRNEIPSGVGSWELGVQRLRGLALLPVAGLIVFGMLALLSKETAVALPVVLLAYDWLVAPSSAEGRRRRLGFVFVPALALLGAAAIFRLSAAAGPIFWDAPLHTLLTQAIVVWRYLALLVLPVGQTIMHAVHPVTSLADPLAWMATIGLLVLGWIAFRLRRRHPLITFGIIWYLAVIAPSSSVIALREGMAEHRAYLASAGVFIAVAALAAPRRLMARGGRPAFSYAAGVAVLIAALGAATVARNEVWASPIALWEEATLHAAGMWEPHYALGDALRDSGNCAAAVAEYEAVTRMRPDHRDAHTNLGICLAQLNRIAEAEAAFRRTLEIDPTFVRGYTNLGALALVAHQPERAQDFYLRAIHVDPRNVLARMQLARLYETVFRDFHSAARMCGEARALAPFTPGVVECVERNQRLAAGK